MENAIDIYIEDVNRFDAFLELNINENHKNEEVKPIYSLYVMKSVLIRLFKELKNKHS